MGAHEIHAEKYRQFKQDADQVCPTVKPHIGLRLSVSMPGHALALNSPRLHLARERR